MTNWPCSSNPVSLRSPHYKPPRCAPRNFSAAPASSAPSLPESAPTSSCSLPILSPTFTTPRKSRPSGSVENILTAPPSTSSSPPPSTGAEKPGAVCKHDPTTARFRPPAVNCYLNGQAIQRHDELNTGNLLRMQPRVVRNEEIDSFR